MPIVNTTFYDTRNPAVNVGRSTTAGCSTSNSRYPDISGVDRYSSLGSCSYILFETPSTTQKYNKVILSTDGLRLYQKTHQVSDTILFSYKLYDTDFDFDYRTNDCFSGTIIASEIYALKIEEQSAFTTIDLGPFDFELDISGANLSPNSVYAFVIMDENGTDTDNVNEYTLYFGKTNRNWRINLYYDLYNVEYNSNGGNLIDISSGFSDNLVITDVVPTWNNETASSNFNIIGSGGDLDVSMTATKTDTIQHIFLGWNTDPLATEPLYTAGQEVSGITENITLYAIWRAQIIDTVYSNNTLSDLPIPEKSKSTKTYSITLDANGGTARTDIIYCAINIFYTFKEWVDQNNQPIDNDMQFTESTTVYASWIETNSGTINLPTATKEGCTFLGWSESKTGSDLVSNVYTPTKDCTLYAIYKSGYFIEGYIRLSNKWVKLE